MKIIMIGLGGVALCAAVAAGLWLGTDPQVNEAAPVAASTASSNPERTASADQPSGMWAWGMSGANKTDPGTPDSSLNVMLAQALKASTMSVEGGDARERLRKAVKDDPAVMKQLMQGYDKESNVQARQLIISLLSNIEKPEILAFSKRLAASSDITQRKDGLRMLQNLSGDSAEVRPVILQILSRDTTPEVIMMALSALRPPAEGTVSDPKDAAAVVAQLRELTRNSDPNVRVQSLMQLAQWDKADSSQDQWAQALTDQSPQVRQAALTGVAQSGTKSDTVKAALISLANNQNESKDVRGSALQVLERFTLSKEEGANIGQLRSQILGS